MTIPLLRGEFDVNVEEGSRILPFDKMPLPESEGDCRIEAPNGAVDLRREEGVDDDGRESEGCGERRGVPVPVV